MCKKLKFTIKSFSINIINKLNSAQIIIKLNAMHLFLLTGFNTINVTNKK